MKYGGWCHGLKVIFQFHFCYMIYKDKLNLNFWSSFTNKTDGLKVLDYIYKAKYIFFIIKYEKLNLEPFNF